MSLVAQLRAHRNADGGWPYYAGKTSRLEPTCWALLALQAAGEPATLDVLAAWPRRDGWFLDRSSDAVNVAFNGLAGVTLAAFDAPEEMTAPLVAALVASKGATLPPSEINRQDNSLEGWPWTEGTFSWVEPTAWGLLGVKTLSRLGRSREVLARVEEGERLLHDRVCREGGWNHGNSNMLGEQLKPYVLTTALALLALADRKDASFVRDSVEQLYRMRLSEKSGSALALAAIGLATHGKAAPELIAAMHGEWARTRFLGNLHTIALAAYTVAADPNGYEAFTL